MSRVSPPATPSQGAKSDYQIATQRLLVVSGIIDLGLGALKVSAGVVANSHALIADGIHSFSDLATDIMVWFFNRVGAVAPDDDHPY